MPEATVTPIASYIAHWYSSTVYTPKLEERAQYAGLGYKGHVSRVT